MDKLSRLRRILKSMGSAVVAYSGGVDSTFLLKVAHEVLGKSALAVTAASPTYTREELVSAKYAAESFGARHKVIKTREFKDRRFTTNPANRCYYCKRELLRSLVRIARENRCNCVIEASTVSDKKDFRPGGAAVREQGARSPLQEAGFTKDDVRLYSKKLGLSTWNKPSQACLASRIPYGIRITPAVLTRVRRGEAYLRKLGFRQVRLRHYNGLCRIEVEKDLIPALTARREKIVKHLKRLGYRYITIDLEGYRTGSMNSEVKKLWKKYT